MEKESETSEGFGELDEFGLSVVEVVVVDEFGLGVVEPVGDEFAEGRFGATVDRDFVDGKFVDGFGVELVDEG